MGRVEGKVATIAGASRGQRRAYAVRLAQEGADIIAIDVLEEIVGAPYPAATEAHLADTVAQVEALDRRIMASKADVRDVAALEFRGERRRLPGIVRYNTVVDAVQRKER